LIADRTSAIQRTIRYVCAVTVLDGCGALTLGWLLAPYFVDGTNPQTPPRTVSFVVMAVLIGIIAGASRRALVPPPPFSRSLLSRRSLRALDRMLTLVGSVALARFVVPHLWSHAPLVGSTPGVGQALFWYGLLAVAGWVAHLLPLAARQMRETADELLARDTRRPILYLRSFEMETGRAGVVGMIGQYRKLARGGRDGSYLFAGRSHATRIAERTALNVQRSIIDEQMVFAHAFSRFGPYIAIGKPSESFKDMDLGAAKKYVENHEWQQAVSEWLRTCAAVVIEAADSEGLRWELAQVVAILPPHRVLVICPHTGPEYARFFWSCASLFPHSLPEKRPPSRLLGFDGTWHPVEIENVRCDVVDSLRPFFQNIEGYVPDRPDPPPSLRRPAR
jgi:hypothetical protein